MTRRIALSALALITALLLLAVIPLGWSMTERERLSFRDAAASATRALASAAEEYLSDHRSAVPAQQLIEEARDRGDCASVYDRNGRIAMSTDCAGTDDSETAQLVAAVLAHPQTRAAEDDQRLTTAIPIGDSAETTGVAVLSRSAEPLNHQILVLWGWLALIGTGVLVGAVMMAGRLARWVGRPLLAVARAAQRLGEGALDVRAPAEEGPQEVRRLAATFNTMAARTEALVHGHRAVVADVSHQLRTPLAALRLRLDLLAADADGDAAVELSGAQDEVARLSRLVDGLLAVARAEHAVPRPVAVRVDQLVAERLAAWEPVAHERRVGLAANCRTGLTARLGSGDLEQVLDNLIANALDAVQEGGRVEITAVARGDSVRLQITDNGPGMSAAARQTAFRRFGNPEASGTGLGLAIVHRLITANGGTAELAETPGGGLTILLTVPAAPRGRERATAPAPAVPHTAES